MNKILIVTIAMALAIGLASASSQGFGEVASLNSCHCLMFNSTSTTHTWTLINTYNKSLAFYVVKPNIDNVAINTSVTNGTIPANSYYTITVTVVSHSAKNESGDIVAYAGASNAMNSTGAGTSITLAAAKLLEITANTTIAVQSPQQQKSSNQSTTGTTVQSTSTGSTIIQNVQNKNASTQSSTGNSSASAALNTPYIIIAMLVIVVCILCYYVVMGKKGKGNTNATSRGKSNLK